MDKALKQRLVGASVLIILTVIILPMLLSGRSDTLQQGSREIEMPPKPEEVSISKRRFPVGIPDKPTAAAEGPDERGAAAEFIDAAGLEGEGTPVESDGGLLPGDQPLSDDTLAESQDSSEQSPSEQSLSEQSPAAVGSPADELQPGVSLASEQVQAPSEKAPAVARVGVQPQANDVDLAPLNDSDATPRYLVQVASFSSDKRADALAAELRSSGMNVEVDIVERNAGRLHRVRVGAYSSRADADEAVTKIKAGSKGLSPRVVDLRPEDAAPVTAPSDPMVRWVVQVGSFSSAKSAESQVAQLRLAGLPAFSEKVTSSNGSVYKVRVGPEINRDKATALAERIAKEQNLKGFVTTQE